MREGDQKTEEVCPELGLFRMGQGSSSGFLCCEESESLKFPEACFTIGRGV